MATPDPAPEPQKPRRRWLPFAIGGSLALAGGLGIGWALLAGDRGGSPAPPASEAGLVIDSSGAEDARIDPGKPLRCFVQGKYVGEISLTECAQKNGVATDALDVGLDQSGALAAADQAGQTLTPLPPVEEIPPAQAQPPQPDAAAPTPEVVEGSGASAAAPGGGASCWRHAGGGRWRKLAGEMDLDACVQSLFAGRCETSGGALYGRWGQETLRLVTGRVEVSDDNRTFRALVGQAPDCSVPPVG